MALDMALFEGIEGLDEILATIREDVGDARSEDEVQDDAAKAGYGLAGDDESEALTAPTRPPLLFVDADACPVTREALAEARRAGIGVIIAGNTTQNLEAHIRPGDPRSPDAAGRRGFWVDTLVAGVGADSADFAIVERLQPGDAVVTQDIGLAGMCLGRGASAIGVRGRPYDRATIDAQLLIRHEEKKVRRQGGRTKGPAPFTGEDRARFTRNLRQMLEHAVAAWRHAQGVPWDEPEKGPRAL